jgi:hypothetical protein
LNEHQQRQRDERRDHGADEEPERRCDDLRGVTPRDPLLGAVEEGLDGPRDDAARDVRDPRAEDRDHEHTRLVRELAEETGVREGEPVRRQYGGEDDDEPKRLDEHVRPSGLATPLRRCA